MRQPISLESNTPPKGMESLFEQSHRSPSFVEMEKAAAATDDPFAVEDKFSQKEPVNLATGLHKFLNSSPSDEDLQEIERRTGDPKVAAMLRDEMQQRFEEQEALAFIKDPRHNGYLAIDENMAVLMAWLRAQRLSLNRETLHEAYEASLGEGTLEMNPNVVARLSDSQRLTVVRIAQSGNIPQAIITYLQFALPDADPNDILGEPGLVELCNDACAFVWTQIQLDFPDTEEAWSAVSACIGNRPWTVELLQKAWTEVKSNVLNGPAPEEVLNVDDLSTEDIRAALALHARRNAGR